MMAMRSLVLFLLALVPLLGAPLPVHAQSGAASRVVSIESWVEEWDEAAQSWVRISEPTVEYRQSAQNPARRSERIAVPQMQRFERFAVPSSPMAQPALPMRAGQRGEHYGPFQVLDGKRAALLGTTDTLSPRHFAQMLSEHPGIEVLEMIEAPGTRDDIANLKLGRMIREKGIATHVPAGGSVRSGAVELFLAGAERKVAEGAQFAVHSWMDTYGRQPEDFAPDAPENRLYLDYYRDMGMSEDQAEAFYAMTNSVPHQSALWLDAVDMRGWIAPELKKARELPTIDAMPRREAPRLAYLDVSRVELAPLDFSDIAFPEFEIGPIKLASLDSRPSIH